MGPHFASVVILASWLSDLEKPLPIIIINVHGMIIEIKRLTLLNEEPYTA